MKKLLGILLALTGFVFLIWVFLAHPSTLIVRLLLNMIGFFAFAGGLLLAGVNLFGFGKPKEPYEREEALRIKKKKEPEKVELKEFKEEDHDKYRPR
jgi:hypothetical protein